jgi:twitching motility protein PilT
MARIDTFISQLVQHDGDALVLEGGNNVFLMKAGAMDPLVDPRRGVVQNEHVLSLIREIVPASQADQVGVGVSTSFVYRSPEGLVTVKTATRDGRYMARVKFEPTAGASSDGFSPLGSAPHMPATTTRNPVFGPGFNAHAPYPPSASEEAPPITAPSSPYAASTVPSRPFSSESSAPGGQTAALMPGGKPRAEAWFKVFLSSRASDLHLTSNNPSMMRIDGDIRPEPLIPTLSAEALEDHLYEIMPRRNRAEFDATNDTDFAYEMPAARLRCNVFRDRRGIGAVFRKIPTKILSTKDLNLPQAIVDLGKLRKGLVLVTGPTGAGKSTTVAALIDWVNSNRSDHIITVEDPIEFVHEPKKCLIHQRQVGEHTQSFSRALRAALREDPDIVLVGEMRDLETIAIAIETAETGHLVFGTLHTSTAASTVDRIIDQFPADRQDQIRTLLAESLKGVVSQTLCKKKGGGRVAAYEILLATNAISNVIRERKTHQIPSMMQTSRGLGMQTLNDALSRLVKDGLITPEEAIDRSVERALLAKDLRSAGIVVAYNDDDKAPTPSSR